MSKPRALVNHRYVCDAVLSAFVFSSLVIVAEPPPAMARSCESEKCSPRATCYEVRRGFRVCNFSCGLFTCSCRAGGGRCTKRRGDGERSASLSSTLGQPPASFQERVSEVACDLGEWSPWSTSSCTVENGLLLASCDPDGGEDLRTSVLSETPEVPGGPLVLGSAP